MRWGIVGSRCEGSVAERWTLASKWKSFLSLIIVFHLAACRGDETITRGVEGSQDWLRKLHATVPLGSPVPEARILMERNGFHCKPATDPVVLLWCEKRTEGHLGLPGRQWKASFVSRGGVVDEIRGSTMRLAR